LKQISKEKLTIPVNVKVWQNYTALDNYAVKLGYLCPENTPTSLTGWIATMGDSCYDPQRMLEEANDKLETAQHLHKGAIIGLCQTGNFSVGYTIYIKD
jgi:hypothetical protein